MFIVSKKKFIVRRADGSSYLIRKDYIGEIPGDVAESNLVQKAIRGGSIAVPEGKKARQLEEAGKKAAKQAEAHDVRTEA